MEEEAVQSYVKLKWNLRTREVTACLLSCIEVSLSYKSHVRSCVHTNLPIL
jgi:hypothetical protein